MFYVVLLAMVAGFLAMRLYMVLGKRTGHEQPLPKPAEERVIQSSLPRTIDATPEAAPARLGDDKVEAGLRAIAAGTPGFNAAEFVEGAKNAYRMILEAFWQGDRKTLDWLCEPEVAAAFEAAIDAREAAGEVLGNRLVAIERATVDSAAVEGRVARITIRFDADVAAVTRDRDGNVVSGSLTDAVETHEVWTFARPLDSSDPNWKLAETDEA